MCYQSVTSFGNPGDPWATRFAAAEAAADNLCIPPGSYAIGSDLTLSKNWQVLDGAIIEPGSGVTVTFAGSLQAARYRIFDLSAGGTAAFEPGAAEGLPPQWWGAATDGLTQSTAAVQAALHASADSGIPIDLGPIPYLINATLDLAGSVEIVGAEGGTPFATVAKNQPVFRTAAGAASIRISRIRALGERTFLEVASDFTEIVLTGNVFTGVADSATNYFVFKDVGTEIDPVVYTAATLRACDNELRQCTALYVDGLTAEDVVFDDNVVRDGTRFVVRARSIAEGGPDASNGPRRVSIRRNQFLGVNTGLSELGTNVARVVQTSAVESITMTDNHIERLLTNDTGTVIYWSFGSLEFGRNTVRGVQSQTTGNHIISDKSGAVNQPGRYSHRFYDNVFDQTDVAVDRTPEAVYRIGAAQNVVCDNDTFIGCLCPAYSVYQASLPQSSEPPAAPRNVVLQNATVIDHRFPVVVELIQYQKSVVVRGFTVHRISNPEGLVPTGGELRLRFVTLYASRPEAWALPDIEDIYIRDNTIVESDDTFVIAYVYRHANNSQVEIRNVVIDGNVTRQAAALCRFINGATLGEVTVTNNVAPVSTISVGTPPPVLTLEGNTPAPSGTHTWTAGTLAPGATSTRTIVVTGARVGDFAQVAPSVAIPAGLQLQSSVTAANVVTATLINVTGTAIVAGTFEIAARVTYR